MEKMISFFGTTARKNLALEYKTGTGFVDSYEVTEAVMDSVNLWLERHPNIEITHRWIGFLNDDIMMTLMYDDTEANHGEKVVIFDGGKLRENLAKRRNEQRDSLESKEIADVVVRATNNWLSKSAQVTLTHRYTGVVGKDMVVILMYREEATQG